MKVSLHSSKLRQAAEVAVRTAPAKPTMPMLGCARIEATAGQLIVGATDYDTWGRTEHNAEVHTAGETAVSARLLKQIADVLPEGMIDLTVKGSTLHLTSGRSRASAPTLPVEDFPAWPEVQPGPRWVVNGPALARVLAACDDVLASAARLEVPELEKIALHFTPDGLRIETTDRYRGYTMTVPWAEPPGDQPGAPAPDVPVFMVGSTVRSAGALAKAEPRLHIELPTPTAYGGRLFRLGGVGVQLLTRHADDAVWPKLSKVMPSRTAGRTYTVDTEWLLRNLDAAGGFVDRGGAVRVTVDPDGIGVAAASAANGTLDVADGPVKVSDDWGPDPFEQSFNSHFLGAAAKAAGAEAVTVRVTTPTRPVLVTVPDDDSPQPYAAVVMPIRVNN